QDQGYLILYAQLPDAASLERTEAVVKRATNIVLETEGITHVNAYAGYSVLAGTSQSNPGTLFARLAPFEERAGHPGLSAEAIIGKLRQNRSGIEDAHLAVFAPPPARGLSSVGGFKLQIQDRATVGT